MLAELTVKEFLDKVAGSDPVPGRRQCGCS